jgi:hypothetical protein
MLTLWMESDDVDVVGVADVVDVVDEAQLAKRSCLG